MNSDGRIRREKTCGRMNGCCSLAVLLVAVNKSVSLFSNPRSYEFPRIMKYPAKEPRDIRVTVQHVCIYIRSVGSTIDNGGGDNSPMPPPPYLRPWFASVIEMLACFHKIW